MKPGMKVEYYVDCKRSKTGIRWATGTLINFDELMCSIVPDGKNKAVLVPPQNIRAII